jgi:hypothetical protein
MVFESNGYVVISNDYDVTCNGYSFASNAQVFRGTRSATSRCEHMPYSGVRVVSQWCYSGSQSVFQ